MGERFYSRSFANPRGPKPPPRPSREKAQAMDHETRRKNLVAAWVFDSLPVLNRFHLWLEDVEEEFLGMDPTPEDLSFAGRLEKAFLVATAVTALGARLFGRYGEARGSGDKTWINRVKKDADAISAYALSEGLWHLTRNLPENHALMVSLGEGLMPKVGETHEMGSNPLLGFGRIYARPQVAQFLEPLVAKLINDDSYRFEHFQEDLRQRGVVIWGAAIDTLENTSRFAKGAETGPMTVLHVFDQPMVMTRPYEGYMGTLVLPGAAARTAGEESILLAYHTPRKLVLQAVLDTYPGLKPENVHVWTLGGPSRAKRISGLWEEWKALGVHLVDDGWTTPYGMKAFTSSGTYAPTYMVGSWEEGGEKHAFLCDGYAASAEALQAASLAPILDLSVSLALFSDKFELPFEAERKVMLLDPEDQGFEEKLRKIAGPYLEVDAKVAERYADMIREASEAGVPWPKATFSAEDFFPSKFWRSMALSGYMCPDPYSGAPGVEKVGDGIYQVTAQLASKAGTKRVRFTFRLREPWKTMKLIFNPLLDRFVAGEDYRRRPVKISDSGRIRNELQTLCPLALESFGTRGIRVHFSKINEGVMPKEKQAKIREILAWFKENHPVWFSWLELAD